MKQLLYRLFDIRALLNNHTICGELPPSGEMYRTFLKIAWPSVIEAVLVGLVGIVDTIMVGSLGDNAIKAVGITTQPKFILLCTIMSLNIGITAVAARRRGEDNREGANHVLRNGIILSLMIIAALTFLGYRLAEPFLRVAGAKDTYIADAVVYFRIIVISLIFQAVNLTINAAQKGCGYTKISMTTNMIGNVVNIVFNYLLINGIGPFPRLEVRGAAIATLLGTMTACALAMARLLNPSRYLNIWLRAPWKLSKDVLVPVAKVSSSAFVEQICARLGFFAFNMMVARLTDVEYTTHIICMNFLSFSFCFGDGFQIAASALVGQKLGAKRTDLAYIYGRIGQRVVFFASLLICSFMLGFKYQLIELYSDTPEVLALGGKILLFVAVITYGQTAAVIFNGCLRGAGDTRFTAVISLVSITLVRPAAGYIFMYAMELGLYGAWFAILLDQMARLILGRWRFMGCKWMKIRL